MEFKDEYLEKRFATFGELKKNILKQDATSEYKQASIVMIRNAYIDLELCEGRTQPTSEQLEHDGMLGNRGFSVGDYCTVFDGNRWIKTGDIGDNECFWVNALITGFRKTEYNEILIDVVFDNGKESKGHYIEGVRHVA